MTSYTSISIIFNPKSTGNGQQLAEELKGSLLDKDSTLPIKLVATKHAGHAETLAYELSLASKKPLIISASGDGGYHELVNGIMRAIKMGAQPVAGLLPAGNANDHFQSMHTSDIVASIIKQKEQQIDVLTLRTLDESKTIERYSHSYIGIGLTPQVGRELNKRRLNWFNEIGIVLRVLLFLRPVRVIVDNKTQSYDSLIFSNIDRMSKVLTLSKKASVTDGKFEMTVFKRRSKFKLIRALLQSSVSGFEGKNKLDEFNLKTINPLLVQMDGEITKINADTSLQIGIERKALTCIV